MIKCNKCAIEKEESEYYQRNKVCKECTKKRVAAYVKTDQGKEVKRRATKRYASTDAGRKTQERADANYNGKPSTKKKQLAKWAVKRAIKSGILEREHCEVCGRDDVVGHHDDYDRQLDVRWLCSTHHKQWHMENGEGANASQPVVMVRRQ